MQKKIFPFFLVLSFITIISCVNHKADQVYPPVVTTCDTSAVKYSQQVVSIMSNSCYVCHSGSASAGAGIKLDTHANLAIWANSGTLLKAITHSAGASPMPKSGTILASCNIAIIRTWIRNGSPNN